MSVDQLLIDTLNLSELVDSSTNLIEIPKLIYDYHYNNIKIELLPLNSLKIHCLINLIKHHIKDDFEIEETLDIFNVGGIIVSYFKIDQLCQKLKIRHIEELFEQLTLICANLLEIKVKDQINYLSKTGELVKCYNCRRMSLHPNDDYYYAICDKCDSKIICNQRHYSGGKEKCYNCNFYYQYIKVPSGHKAKLNEEDRTILIYKNTSLYQNNTNPELQCGVRIVCYRNEDTYYRHPDYCINYCYYCPKFTCLIGPQYNPYYPTVLDLFNKYKIKYQG